MGQYVVSVMDFLGRDYQYLFEYRPWIELLGATAIGFRPTVNLVKRSLHERIFISCKCMLSDDVNPGSN